MPANKLKEYRESAGYSQDRLARIIGVDRGTIANWEKGKTQLKGDSIARLCALFNCEFYDLLNIPA